VYCGEGSENSEDFQGGIRTDLGSNHESTKEHSLIGPFLGLEVEIWFCPGDIDESDEEN
jgi:hypothetical protein